MKDAVLTEASNLPVVCDMLLKKNEELKNEVQSLKPEVNRLKNEPKHDKFGQVSGDKKKNLAFVLVFHLCHASFLFCA